MKRFAQYLICILFCTATSGDVGDICFADQENIIAGVGNGDVMLLKYDSHATSMVCLCV